MEQNNSDNVNLEQLLVKGDEACNRIEVLKAELANIMKSITLQKESQKLLENKKKCLLKPPIKASANEKAKHNKKGEGQEILATTILPKEMWAEVFSYLNNAKDIRNANWVCSTFHDIINPRITTWTFGKIVSELSTYLEINELLLCRKVCKKWKVDVDNFIEDSHLRNRFCKWTQLKNDDSFTEQAIQNILNTSNPFAMRAVSIEETSNYQREYLRLNEAYATWFWYWIKILLDRFQTRIAYFSLNSHFLNILKLPMEASTPTDLIRRNVLNSLPNLKSLIISGFQSGERASPYNKHEMVELPELKRLYELSVELGKKERVLMRQLFSKYSKQIKSLTINTTIMSRFSTIGFLIASKFDWQNLTELALGKVEMDLINLTNLKAFKSLKKLSININRTDTNCLEDILLMTNELVKVAPKFCFLSLILDNVFSIKEINNLPVDLYASEKLKGLKVNMRKTNAQNHFAFLLRFPFIKYLNIYGLIPERPPSPGLRRQLQNFQMGNNLNNFMEYELGEEIVEVYQFIIEYKGMDSNIWGLLPSLDILTAFGKSYGRLSE